MRIDLSSNIDDVLGWTARLHPQFQFAAAKALTDTVRSIQQGLPKQLEQDLDKPTPFTARGFYSVGARKDRLLATVGVKDTQAQYLWWQVEGGNRAPQRKALRLPSVVQLNEYGNLPRGLIGRLVALAKSQKQVSHATGRRLGRAGFEMGGKSTTIFYGQPRGGTADRPPGLYLRVDHGRGDRNRKLIPIVVFPRQQARYTKRFDFHGYALRKVDAEFGPILLRSWNQALVSAK